MNAIFDFKRAGLLIRRYFIERFHGELIFWIASIIVMMFLRNIPASLWIFAIIYCIFRTGLFFREIHSPTNRINYFMIPATQIEKFVVSLLLTIVYFWAVMFVTYVIGNILGTWINNLLANIGLLSNMLGFHHSDLNWVLFNSTPNIALVTVNGMPANVGATHTLLTVLVEILAMQSIFILGGIYFKKNSVVLTILTLVIIGFILVLIGGIEARYLITDAIKDNGINQFVDTIVHHTGRLEIIKYIFACLLVPYLWITSYIRLTEKEV